MLSDFCGGATLVLCAMLICYNCADAAMSTERVKNAVEPIGNNCIDNVGIDPALVDGMAKGEFPENETLQCYIKCAMTASKSFKNGKPVLEALLKQIKIGLPEELQANASEATKYCCENLDFDDKPCVAAWQFLKCTYVRNPQGFFFP